MVSVVCSKKGAWMLLEVRNTYVWIVFNNPRTTLTNSRSNMKYVLEIAWYALFPNTFKVSLFDLHFAICSTVVTSPVFKAANWHYKNKMFDCKKICVSIVCVALKKTTCEKKIKKIKRENVYISVKYRVIFHWAMNNCL